MYNKLVLTWLEKFSDVELPNFCEFILLQKQFYAQTINLRISFYEVIQVNFPGKEKTLDYVFFGYYLNRRKN